MPSLFSSSIIVTPLLTFNQSLSPLFSPSISHCHPSSHFQSVTVTPLLIFSHCHLPSHLQSVIAVHLLTFNQSLPSLFPPSSCPCHPSNHLQSVNAIPQITFNQSLLSLKSPSISHCHPSNHLQSVTVVPQITFSYCHPSNHLQSVIAVPQITFHQPLPSFKSPSINHCCPSNHLQSVIVGPQITFSQSQLSLFSSLLTFSHCCPSNHLSLLPHLSPAICRCCSEERTLSILRRSIMMRRWDSRNWSLAICHVCFSISWACFSSSSNRHTETFDRYCVKRCFFLLQVCTNHFFLLPLSHSAPCPPTPTDHNVFESLKNDAHSHLRKTQNLESQYLESPNLHQSHSHQ